MRAQALILALGCTAVLLPSFATAQLAGNVDANVRFDFHAYVQNISFSSPSDIPFPLEAYGVVTSSGPFADILDPPPFNLNMWAYANETGKVRAQTIAHEPLGEVPPPGDTDWSFRTTLHWQKTFTKGSAADTAKFTVNPIDLFVFGQTAAANRDPYYPYAKISIDVQLLDANDKLVSTALSTEVSLQARHIAGCVLQMNNPFNLYLCQSGQDALSGYHGDRSPLLPKVDARGLGKLGVTSDPYHGSIDLTWIPLKSKYTIAYALMAEAWTASAETNAEAFVGDPLDTSSGFDLQVTSLPAPADEKPGHVCDVESDRLRYADNHDGTVTDRTTGLMWQRCPTGYRFSDAGTPDDPSDDRCSSQSNAGATWQSALKASASDLTAGHDDWRLPNVKELASIVELGCLSPAIETGPFPDTLATAFWSSTPARAADAAMSVDFFAGDVAPLGKAKTGLARLVRAAQAPVLPPPALRVGRAAPVTEGDDATIDLVFPITLAHPATTEVSFQYATADDLAHAGEDYVATSGTATIAAGETATEVHVPVRGDRLGEVNETLALVVDGISSGARLEVASNLGAIVDDDPVATVWRADVGEGDGGTSTLAFAVSLSKPALDDVTFDYVTSAGTATEGVDYLPASGRVSIPAGQRAAIIPVTVLGDTAREADESLTLTLTAVSANARLETASAAGVIVDDDAPTLAALDDSGLDACSDSTGLVGVCPLPGFPGQDGDFGRDAAFPSDDDGPNGFVFTKLDGTGAPLADQSVAFGTGAWSCVRDEVTGLWWEVKTNDGGLHDRDWTYSWFNSTGVNDGGDLGTANGGVCLDGASCDTEKFVAAVNASGLCGRKDWRLPDRTELMSILDSSGTGGALRPWFANETPTNGTYWTSTPLGSAPHATSAFGLEAWTVSTAGPGASLSELRSNPAAVRVVRGGN